MNNNDDKYYVPDISDIYDGYELEYCEDVFKENKWQTHIHREGDTYNILSLGRIYTIRELLETSLIRVPFLTKEQIEAEGWVKSDIQDNLYYFKNENTGIIYGLMFNFYGKQIIFNTQDALKSSLYRGECKSINEFRLICKWLKI